MSRVLCSCGRSHNSKTIARVQRHCRGIKVTVSVLPALKVAVPNGQPVMMPIGWTPAGRALLGAKPGSARHRNIVCDTHERLGGSC